VESPLHEFELHTIWSLQLFGLDISINKAVILMWLAVGGVFLLFYAVARSPRLFPGKLQVLVEGAVEFLRKMARENIGEHYGDRFVPFLATLFFFILFMNLLGLIPGSYTVTSQLFVTATLALMTWGLSLVVGFAVHGLHFLKIFSPAGTPWWLTPFMIPIEIISHSARPLSLALRLFANMTAGHTILAVLFGLALSLHLALGWLPFGFTVAIYGLEFFVAFIQAYIFTILASVYIGDAVHLH
jgi:F-type H+-transporting ATPase subunit a